MIMNFNQYIKENNSDNQFFKTYEETKNWLDEMFIKKYIINDDLTVDVDGYVDISNENITNIPVQFNIVKGWFNCNYTKITSLIGSPKEVYGDFYCSFNKNLKTLYGAPEIVKGNFNCQNNKLTSLDGLSIYNLKKIVDKKWYVVLNSKIKEDYFDKILEENPEIISLIYFRTYTKFKNKWNHLFNANKFDLI